MTSLYNLTKEYRELLSKEELTDEDILAISSRQGEIEDKVIQCAYVIRELEADVAHCESAIKIAQGKKKRLANNLERLEEYVLDAMQNNNLTMVDKEPLFDVKIKTNPASVDDYEPVDIPKEYWVHTTKVSLDRNKVKDDIKNGVVIPGARLINKKVLKIV